MAHRITYCIYLHTACKATEFNQSILSPPNEILKKSVQNEIANDKLPKGHCQLSGCVILHFKGALLCFYFVYLAGSVCEGRGRTVSDQPA